MTRTRGGTCTQASAVQHPQTGRFFAVVGARNLVTWERADRMLHDGKESVVRLANVF